MSIDIDKWAEERERNLEEYQARRKKWPSPWPPSIKRDKSDLLEQCISQGGPVQVYLTVAKIQVCGRCGHQVKLHR